MEKRHIFLIVACFHTHFRRNNNIPARGVDIYMNKISLHFLASMLLLSVFTMTSLADRYQEYIDTYSDMAIEQQKNHGIPASITLAQGLLESGAGNSRLAKEGNNHFGIKCHTEWKGDTMLRNDDAPNECFRVYDSALESFNDHSRFLLKKRYESLFSLDPLDYKGWAAGLKKCGYATDPNYASRLIAIIERYALYLFDTPVGRMAEENALFIQSVLASSHPVRKSRGLHYVIAAPGDTYASIAEEFNIDKKKLMAYNDVERDHKIKDWEEVYLQEKFDDPPADIGSAVIGDGESMHSVSQRYGMKLATIKSLNPKAKDKPGVKLILK